MLETSWLWFVISKEYVELIRPKIESRDPIFFTGTRSRSRVSGNDRLFPRGSEFGPNLEIPAGPAIQLRPGPGDWPRLNKFQIQKTFPLDMQFLDTQSKVGSYLVCKVTVVIPSILTCPFHVKLCDSVGKWPVAILTGHILHFTWSRTRWYLLIWA